MLNVTKRPAIYRVGEKIAAELSFSAAIPGKYAVIDSRNNGGGETRSPAVCIQRFISDPVKGTEDPSVQAGRAGIVKVGGQIYGAYPLSKVPQTVPLDLNQWLRFNKPGVYRVRAQSRVVPFRGKRTISAPSDPIVNSNELKLTILPADAAWSETQLNDIQSILVSPAATGEQKTVAALRLRYLNTKASTAQLARDFPASEGQPYHWALYQGLLESSWRTTAIKNLDEAMHNPLNRVSHDTVVLMTGLERASEHKASSVQRKSP